MLSGSISGALIFVFYFIVETFAFRVTARLEDPQPITSQHPRCLFEYFTWCVLLIIIIFIYLPSDVISQEKTATSSRSITKASKYAIPLKPNTQNLQSQSDI